MAGWIKIQRDLIDHWCAADPNFLAVWLRLLSEANFKTKKSMINGRPITIKRGQVLFGLPSFSKRSGVSISKLRRIISVLLEEGMIDRLKTNKYSIISITNYEKHQADDSQKTVKSQADDSQTTTSEEGKQGKDNIDDPKPKPKRKSSLPDNCPTIEDQKLAIKYWEKKNTACDLSFTVDGFRAGMLSNGDLALDWSAKWRTWYVNASKWCKQSGSPTGTPLEIGQDDGPLFNQTETIKDPLRADWEYAEKQFKDKGLLPKRFVDSGTYDCPKDILDRNNGFKIQEAAQ